MRHDRLTGAARTVRGRVVGATLCPPMSDVPPPQFGRGPRNFVVPTKTPPQRSGSRRRRWLIAGGIAGLIVVTAATTLLVLALQSHAPQATPTPTPVPRTTPTAFVPTASPSATAASSTTPATPAGTASPSPISDPRVATAAALYPPGPQGTSCGANTGDYGSACPVTDQFGQKLHAVSQASPPYEALCRCNVAWAAVSYALTTESDTAATVTLTFSFSGGHSMTLVLALVNQSGSWLGDDTSCGPGTSFDATYPQPQACYLNG